MNTENDVMAATWPGVGSLGEKVKGLKSAARQLQNSHRDVRYSIGNIVNKTIITMCGAGWALDLLGGHFVN